jgi:hypothetical protein
MDKKQTYNNENKEERQSMNDRWIDKQDILTSMHISSRTLQRWRTKGILPFSRIGRKIYYKESDLNKLLGQNIQ